MGEADVVIIGKCKEIKKINHEISHTIVKIEVKDKILDVYLFNFLQDILNDKNIKENDLIFVKGILDIFDNQVIINVTKIENYEKFI